MKILVLGGGVVGVTNAYYAATAGHEVTIIDRQPEPARETSFANGGQVSWSSATPWAAPNVPYLAFKWLFKSYSPLVLRPRLDPAMWRWLLAMLRNCTPARFAANQGHMLALARYSHSCLRELRDRTGIQYDQRTRGTLVLYRTQKELDVAVRANASLARFGITYHVVDRAGCVAREPALARVAEKIAGGVWFVDDESGDCRTFTLALARLAERHGARFVSSTTIERLVASSDRIEGVQTSHGMFYADACIVACGSYTPLLLRPLGVHLPVYPVKGYSITAPIADPASAPEGTLTDETYKTVITRLGDRVRAAGTAELAGFDLALRPARFELITRVVRDLFPAAADLARVEYWCGLRPMTPDNNPVLGATPYKNLFLNTGHGTLGWTLACGSGRLLADLVTGRAPELDPDPFSLARF